MVGEINRQSTGIDRRVSVRSELYDDEDNSDHEYAAMGIADGFRPSGVEAGHNRVNSETSQHQQLPRGRTPPPRPSSTTKPRYDSFALRHDGAMGHVPSRNSTNASSSAMPPITRSSTASTESPFVRAESPYRGPTGPSHPYQMYPQESRLARTASVATTSTVQVPERSYTGPNGPTHPYGMYPQNTVPEAEDSSGRPVVAPVPVGFPGRNNVYQRRLGPDGEEVADIIGPDGHTEQLPPYTQYPDEALARKTRPTIQAPLPGAGGIGLATRNPEFESQEELSTPQSRHSTRSFASDSTHQVNIAATQMSEKPKETRWQRFAKKKACGVIPVWAFILVGAAFVLFAVVLGSVLAALKPRHPPKHNYNPDTDERPQSVVVTMTTTFDATPFTTLPANIASLPTGTYLLPISAPSVAPASCLSNTAQNAAWSCSIPSPLPYQMTISNIPGSDPLSNFEIGLSFGNYTLDILPYGAQPPTLNELRVMKLVNDSDYLDRGPAWFFQTTYNKVVILPENALTASSSTLKRDINKRRAALSASDFMGRKGVAQPGDKPWFCYWNGTLLEAFIYANMTSSAGSYTPPSVTSSSSSQSSVQPTNTYSGSTPSSSAQFSGSGGGGPPNYGKGSDPTFLPCYPKVIKLEERRLPISDQNIPPYCIQNAVNSDGTYQPVMNGNLPVTIYLNETIPTTAEPLSEKYSSFDNLNDRDIGLAARQSNSMCGCVWFEQ